MNADTLVVIATNNGREKLQKILKLEQRHPILIVDTGSTDEATVEFLRKRTVENVEIIPGGYDTGAYLHAFENHEFEHYLFMQDSLTPREPDYVEAMHDWRQREGAVVAWSSFYSGLWDSAEQRAWIEEKLGHKEIPEYGIFGPIFLTSRANLVTLREAGQLPVPPPSKLMAQGWERGWAMAFHKCGIPVDFCVQEGMPRRLEMESGFYPIFTKTFGGRS